MNTELLHDIRLSEPSFWMRADREAVAYLRHNDPVCWQEEPETNSANAGRGYWAVLRHADVRYASRATELFVSGHGTELFDLPIDIARAYSGMVNMAPPSTRRCVRSSTSPSRRGASLPSKRRPTPRRPDHRRCVREG